MYRFNENRAPISTKTSLLLILNYVVGYMFIYPRLIVWICKYVLHTYDYLIYLEVIVFAIVFIISVRLSKPLFEESDYNKANRLRENFLYGFKSILLMYFCMIVMNLILQAITQQPASENQMNVITMSTEYPIPTFIMAVLLAPTVEECVFRGAIFRKLRDINYPVAMFVSSFMFGLAHVYSSLLQGNFNDVWYVFVYAMLGYFIGKNYERSGSIYTSIWLHTTINMVSMILIVIVNHMAA